MKEENKAIIKADKVFEKEWLAFDKRQKVMSWKKKDIAHVFFYIGAHYSDKDTNKMLRKSLKGKIKPMLTIEKIEKDFDEKFSLHSKYCSGYNHQTNCPQENIKTFILDLLKEFGMELAGEELNIDKVHNFDWKEEKNKFGNIKESIAKHYAGGEISGYNQKRKSILEHPILKELNK